MCKNSKALSKKHTNPENNQCKKKIIINAEFGTAQLISASVIATQTVKFLFPKQQLVVCTPLFVLDLLGDDLQLCFGICQMLICS